MLVNTQKKIPTTLFPFYLALYEIIVYLSNDMYIPALTEIARDYGASVQLTQLTITVCFIGCFISQLFVGALSDNYGRKRTLLYGMLLFVLSTIACALSPSITILLISRFFQGASVSIIPASGYALIHDLYDQNKSIKIIATMNSITILAPAFGPLLGGAILLYTNWNFIFTILAACGAVSLILLYQATPQDSSNEVDDKLELNKILQQYKSIISNKQFIFYTLSFCMLYSGLFAWITAGPFIVINDYHGQPIDFGIIQLIIFSFFILGSYITRIFTNKLEVETIVTTGLLISMLGSLTSILLLFIVNHHLLIIIIAISLFSLGSGLCFPILSRFAIQASTQPKGVTMSIFSLFLTLFSVIGTLIISQILSSTLLDVGTYILISSILAFLFGAVFATKSKPLEIT